VCPGPVLRDPAVDQFSPVIEPLHLGIMGGGPRDRVAREPPPAGPDELVDREVPPDIPDADDVVEPGVRHDDHVRVRPDSCHPCGRQ